jgi:hypothetical protein
MRLEGEAVTRGSCSSTLENSRFQLFQSLNRFAPFKTFFGVSRFRRVELCYWVATSLFSGVPSATGLAI